jgi:CRISPR-associated endonuclease/helicase Cas3
MTRLSPGQFSEFYTEMYRLIYPDETRVPHPWQLRLADRVCAGGGWPEGVFTPTGSGKSVVSLVHVFACAVLDDHPSRMTYVVPRRVLADQVYTEVSRLLELLADEERATAPILVAVREALLERQPRNLDGTRDGQVPVITTMSRGGVYGKTDTTWRDSPTACAVLTMTQDMAMSSLLFAGYGAGLKSRAVQAGLLAVGSVLVFDEAHTMRQSVTTARSVVDMVRESCALNGVMAGTVPVSSVVELTATPTHDSPVDVHTLDASDVADPQSVLSRVLSAPKTVQVSLHHGNNTAMVNASVDAAADLYRTLGNGAGLPGPRTVGVVVNTVADAISVADKLLKLDVSADPDEAAAKKSPKAPTVVVLTGRMRTYDRVRLQERYPGLLTPRGNPDVDFLVCTQVLEIGVDIDLPAMVTQLAPASALVQRFGRVNRRGLYAKAVIHVVGCQSAPAETAESDPDATGTTTQRKSSGSTAGPYADADLARAAAWAESLDRGASPEVLRLAKYTPPEVRVSRPVVERLDASTARGWSVTCGRPPLGGDDRQLWIADDVSSGPAEMGLVLRYLPAGSPLVDDPQCREDLLAALRVDPVETWSIRSSEMQELLLRLGAAESVDAFSLVLSDGSVQDLPMPRDTAWSLKPRAGATVVVWCHGDVALLEHGVPTKGGAGTVAPVPVSALYVNPYEKVDADHCGCGGEHPHARTTSDTVLAFGSDIPAITDEDRQNASTAVWRKHTDAPVWEAVWRTWGPHLWVTAGKSVKAADDAPVWVSGTPWNREESSVWTPLRTPVLLDAHGTTVADMCADVASRAGLAPGFVSALRHAGQHHDSGKADRRFQCWMTGSATPPKTPLAKSGNRVTFGGNRFGLPSGWRHEQLSAALAYRDPAVSSDPEREIITLLVGLSHGHGRSSFPHGFSSLIGDQTHHYAEDLFTHGDWDEMLYAATVRLGPWILGWLEALLRAADHQVSAQGH